MKPVQVPATIQKIETLSDRTIRLRVDTTRELKQDELATLFTYDKQDGWLLFAPSQQELESLELPDEPITEKNTKTPSQRLRAVIYKNWEQTSQKTDFESYYRTIMEKIINKLKDEL